MADRPPLSRYSVIERGGRLVVIDRDTGQTPPTAAERMADHDRRMGDERVAPAKPSVIPDMSAAARAESGLSARPAPMKESTQQHRTTNDSRDSLGAAVAQRGKRPWTPAPTERSAPHTVPTPGPLARRAAPGANGARKTIVTGKWWDSKGPRTIELGPQGQRELTGAFMMLCFVALIAAIVTLFVAPVLLFAAAFLLFRFGGNILGPIGAGLIDKALAERN